jgi:hypothetical protein
MSVTLDTAEPSCPPQHEVSLRAHSVDCNECTAGCSGLQRRQNVTLGTSANRKVGSLPGMFFLEVKSPPFSPLPGDCKVSSHWSSWAFLWQSRPDPPYRRIFCKHFSSMTHNLEKGLFLHKVIFKLYFKDPDHFLRILSKQGNHAQIQWVLWQDSYWIFKQFDTN